MYATWSRVGRPPEIPVTGQRKSVKILGAIELFQTRFHYRQDTVFNASTYLAFLEQLARRYRRQGAMLIQDNASYHKDAEVWGWFSENRHWLEVHQLPPYSPQLNPRNDFGNTPGATEPTIATSQSRSRWLTPSPASLVKFSAIRS